MDVNRSPMAISLSTKGDLLQATETHHSFVALGGIPMDGSRARKFRVSIRLLLSILAVCCILLASVFWNLQLYRRAEQQRFRAITAEQIAAANAEDRRLQAIAGEKPESPRTQTDAEQAKLVAKRQAERAKDAVRVRQLYQELNNLSQLNEQILLEASNPRVRSQKQRQSAGSGIP